MKGIEYRGVISVDGPIVVVERPEKVFYGETVFVRDKSGEKRAGRVIDVSETAAIVQIFGDTTGIDINDSSFEFLEKKYEYLKVDGFEIPQKVDSNGEMIEENKESEEVAC